MLSRGVGGALHYCYLSEDRSEVGIVGTVESCPVTEDDVERPVPSLRDQVELGDGEWIRHRDVRPAVHYSWFVDRCAHSRCYSCREFRGGTFFFMGFEESCYEGLLSF